AARDADEPAVVLVAPASAPLGDVRADAVSCAHELLAYGFTGERRPRQHEIPHRVRQLLREPVHLQILKSRSCHRGWSRLESSKQQRAQRASHSARRARTTHDRPRQRPYPYAKYSKSRSVRRWVRTWKTWAG